MADTAPPNMDRPADHDARMRVVRRWAEWHLGSASWGSDAVAAYLYPQQATDALDAEHAPEAGP